MVRYVRSYNYGICRTNNGNNPAAHTLNFLMNNRKFLNSGLTCEKFCTNN